MIDNIRYDFIYSGENKINAEAILTYININIIKKQIF